VLAGTAWATGVPFMHPRKGRCLPPGQNPLKGEPKPPVFSLESANPREKKTLDHKIRINRFANLRAAGPVAALAFALTPLKLRACIPQWHSHRERQNLQPPRSCFANWSTSCLFGKQVKDLLRSTAEAVGFLLGLIHICMQVLCTS
jgi:hypothetical protein